MRVLDARKIPYEFHTYEEDPSLSGEEIAVRLHEDPDKVFKTLVTQGKTGNYYVFEVPVKEDLDLKKAAKAAGEKSISMIRQKELLPLTGYVHGGCSPIGMKKQLETFYHCSCEGLDTMAVSAGKIGAQVELAPEDLIRLTRGRTADLTVE